MNEAAPLLLHRATVLPEWVDYNGHMSEAYYVLVFGHATDAFLDHIGMDDTARRTTGTSLYTVEAHVRYLHEAHAGEKLRVATQLLGHDAKRVHLHHALLREPDLLLLSTIELMLLHVDGASGRAASMRSETMRDITAVFAAHRRLPPPPHVGRMISLGRAPAASQAQ